MTPTSTKAPVILTIAGFDPSSGAGVTADLKTIAAHGFYGMSCITAMTVQNTQGVSRVEPLEADLVLATLRALDADTEFAAIKIGMLGSAGIGQAIADFLISQSQVPIVLDPVIRSSSGSELIDSPGLQVLRQKLLLLATVTTPNLSEAEALTGHPVRTLAEMKAAAKRLQDLGAKNVAITGGHLAENIDILRTETGEEFEFACPRIDSNSTHGTGCAFSTALACGLASGNGLAAAVKGAKEYVRQAILSAYPIGKGTGPINHFCSR